MRPMFRFFLAAVLSICACMESQAAIVTYTLHDVTFDDGGTVSGFFTRDSSRSDGLTADFDVRITGGSRIAAFDYSPATTNGGVASVSINLFDPSFPLSVLFTASSMSAGRNIQLAFHDDPLLPGGDIKVLTNDCLGMLCSADSTETGLIRFGTGGTVTVSVPEPFLFLFLAAAAGLLVIVRKTDLARW